MTKSEQINQILHQHIRVVFKDAINYKELIESLLDWHENQLPSEIYLTYDKTDGEVFCAFTNKEQCENEATDGGCGMQTVRLINE